MLKKFLPERLARLRVPPFLVAFLCGILPVPVYSSLPDQLLYKPLYGLPILFLALFHRQLIHARNGKEAALLGFSHGLGLFLGGVSWVYVSLADFAAMPVPVAALLTFCFCCYLALYPLLAASIFHVLRRFSPQDLQPWLFAGCFTLAEILRGTLLTGFPWLSLGYSQTPGTSPLAGLAPLLGVYGVSFLAYLSAAWIACLCFPFRRARLGPSAYTWLFLLQLGIFLTSLHWEWTKPSGEPVSVALLQG
ncbi:MAG: hypothetical protein LBB55_06035, partial [Zoogloeaceae bacterium]|nr:hypothetical protein [Zoogloeaceae bacterium]